MSSPKSGETTLSMLNGILSGPTAYLTAQMPTGPIGGAPRKVKSGWSVRRSGDGNHLITVFYGHGGGKFSYLDGLIYDKDFWPSSPEVLLEYLSDVENVACLVDLQVRPDRRRGGIGTQMVAKFLDWAEQKKVEKVFLSAYGPSWLTKFYKRFGFHVVCATHMETIMVMTMSDRKRV